MPTLNEHMNSQDGEFGRLRGTEEKLQERAEPVNEEETSSRDENVKWGLQLQTGPATLWPAFSLSFLQLLWNATSCLHEGTLADFSINVPESITQMGTGLHDRLHRFQKMVLLCCAIWGLFSGICQKSLSSFVRVFNFLEQIRKKSFKT